MQSIYSKFQAYSYLLWLRSPVCGGPSLKPQRLVFLIMKLIVRYHNEAHIRTVLLKMCITPWFRPQPVRCLLWSGASHNYPLLGTGYLTQEAVEGRPIWTDCDKAGDYVVPNVLSTRDLVFRPDNMDEIVPHTCEKQRRRSNVLLLCS